jgi:hypothetical protein
MIEIILILKISFPQIHPRVLTQNSVLKKNNFTTYLRTKFG